MVWQCSTEGPKGFFQNNFANDNIIQLEGFVAVNDENSQGYSWRLLAINIHFCCESPYDELVVAMLWLLSHFTIFKKDVNGKIRVWPIGYFLIAISNWLLSTKIIIIKLINAYYTRNIQNLCADLYRLANALAWCPFCDVDHATLGLKNLTIVSLLFYLILNISLNKILAHSQSLWEPQSLTLHQWKSQYSWIFGTVKRYT